ncbi:MAG: hypothetical protein JXA54_05595 [Candidatus Heimdallarchaeota archaeon]|nr:hypothetical protein [Candidatus Heimdallarchaeota archaeon]
MKCKVIKTTLALKASNFLEIEETINSWLKNNPTCNISHITQTNIESRMVITSIFYED